MDDSETDARDGNSPSRRCVESLFVWRLGPKDIEAGQGRDRAQRYQRKDHCSIDCSGSRMAEELLDTMQHDMLERARTHRDAPYL